MIDRGRYLDAGLLSHRPPLDEQLDTIIWLSALAQRAEGDSRDTPSVRGLPRLFGEYRIDALLGAGAYGAVFRAWDNHLDRPVALKLAWPAVSFSEAASRRFDDEPKHAAPVRHPNVVTVYDSGTYDAVSYIALELIEGPNLAEWCSHQSPLAPRVAAEMARTIAEAVHVIHLHDVVHRDLKPTNILLRPRQNDEAQPFDPVVSDFGLARRPRPDYASTLTAKDEVLGTDPYIPPEYLKGQGVAYGALGDIYSLGVVFYEMLTGQLPFNGESSAHTRELIQKGDPLPVRRLRPSVPRDLETIVHKCLEVHPEQRYVSAQALADDLGRFLAGKPIRARPNPPWHRAWKFVLRKPTFAAMAATLLIVVGLSGAAVFHSAEVKRLADRNERQLRVATSIRRLSESLEQLTRQDAAAELAECRRIAQGFGCGVEWNVLNATINGFERQWQAHHENVFQLRYSPHGDLLASAGKDGRVAVWNSRTGALIAEFFDGIGEANTVSFSADGSLLAYAGDDGRVLIRRIQDHSLILDRHVTSGRIYDSTWVGDNERIAVGGEDRKLYVLDVGTAECKQSQALAPEIDIETGRPTKIASLCYVPDGQLIGVGLSPRGASILSSESLDIGKPLANERSRAISVQFVAGAGGHIATAGETRDIRLWPLRDDGGPIQIPMPGAVCCMAHDPAFGMIYCSTYDGALAAVDVRKSLAGIAAPATSVLGHSGRVDAVACSPDGMQLASGDTGGLLRIWPARRVASSIDVPLARCPSAIEFSPCGRYLAGASGDYQRPPKVSVYDASTGARLWNTSQTSGIERNPESLSHFPSPHIAFHPTGEVLATLCDDLVVREFESRSGAVRRIYALPFEVPPWRLRYSPDGTSLLFMSSLGEFAMVSRTTGDIIFRDENPENAWVGEYSTYFGDLHLVSGLDGDCLLRRADTYVARALSGPRAALNVAAVSRDGRLLAAAGQGEVFLWDLAHSTEASILLGHTHGIINLQFSPDGQTLLSHALDRTLRFWNVATRLEVLRIGPGIDEIASFAINRDGSILIVAVQHAGGTGLRIYRLNSLGANVLRTIEIAADGCF